MKVDSNSKSNKVFIPFLFPLFVGFLASAWVPLRVAAAYKLGECGIGSFWSHSDGLKIINAMYPSIMNEISIIKQMSSDCVANLHTIATSWLLILYFSSLCLSLLLFAFIGPYEIKPGQGRKNYIGMLFATTVIPIIVLIIMYLISRYYALINLSGRPKRFGVDLENGYVNTYEYWINSFAIFASWLFLLWVLYVGVSIFIWLLKEKQRNYRGW